jgi:hypothetical protein
MNKFNTPVCLIFFNRPDLIVQVIGQLKKINAQKIYLFSDGAREHIKDEKDLIKNTRNAVENAIDWDCEIIKWYSDTNIGVFENIAGKALKVFEIENMAIFLEDDNFPDLTFFRYCEDSLKEFENNDDILWICGNNFNKNILDNDYSVIFSQVLHPCGWASWSTKFKNYYDSDLSNWNDKTKKKLIKKIPFAENQSRNYIAFESEKKSFESKKKFDSWDFHMLLSMLYYEKLAVLPKTNLIKNIGVDERATHGATLMNLEVIKYVPQQIIPIKFPIKFPLIVKHNIKFDKELYFYLKPKGLIYGKIYNYLIIKRVLGILSKSTFNLIVIIRKIF